MKKLFALSFATLAILGALALPAHAAVQDTPAQVLKGVAVGPGLNIEVSFQNMTNSQGCGFNGAYVIDNTLDAATKQSILALLLSAKEHGWSVRVRLSGCADRPKFHYAFIEPTWLP